MISIALSSYYLLKPWARPSILSSPLTSPVVCFRGLKFALTLLKHSYGHLPSESIPSSTVSFTSQVQQLTFKEIALEVWPCPRLTLCQLHLSPEHFCKSELSALFRLLTTLLELSASAFLVWVAWLGWWMSTVLSLWILVLTESRLTWSLFGLFEMLNGSLKRTHSILFWSLWSRCLQRNTLWLELLNLETICLKLSFRFTCQNYNLRQLNLVSSTV
jgi:hypothetical protein